MNDLVKKSGRGLTVKSSVLDKIRAATPAKPQTGSRGAPLTERRARLVFGVDATASREPTWESAKRITDRMFEAIPGALDVALAVHGGHCVHTFSPFSADVAPFRAQAAAVRCQAGTTRLCDIMDRTLAAGGVKVMTYIGDAFEEHAADAYALADRFKLRGIKAVMLADEASKDTLTVFREIAERTGGAVLDFRAGNLDLMGDVLQSIATLAVGGRALLATRRSPGAQLLLAQLRD